MIRNCKTPFGDTRQEVLAEKVSRYALVVRCGGSCLDIVKVHAGTAWPEDCDEILSTHGSYEEARAAMDAY